MAARVVEEQGTARAVRASCGLWRRRSARLQNRLGGHRFALALAAALCTLVRTTSAADPPPSLDAWGQVLGRGFDSHLGRLTGACIQGQTELKGNRRGELSHAFNASFDDYFTETQGRLSGSVDLFLIGGSARVDYYAKVARTDHSTSYTMKFDAKLGTALLGQRALTPLGTSTASMSAAQRRTTCGDSYVSEVDLGSSLMITASFHFNEASDFEQFKYEVKVEALFGLISSTDRWTEETSHFAQAGYLVVDALQVGGTPSRLAQAMGGSGPHVCRFDAIGPCQAALVGATAYARSASGYISQFGTPYDPTKLGVLSYRTSRYEDGGHDTLSAPLLPADVSVRSTVQRLSLELAQQTSLDHRAELLLTRVLTPQRRNEVLAVQAKAVANIEGLNRALWVCRTETERSRCLTVSSEEAAARLPVTMSDLQF